MDFRFLAIAAIVLITAIYSGEAVWCYVCNSGRHYQQEACESGSLDSNYLLNCDDEGRKENKNYTMCRKFTQEVEGDYRIVRTCATGGRPGECVARTGTTRIKLLYCECLGDECNAALPSATSLTSSILLVVLPFILLP